MEVILNTSGYDSQNAIVGFLPAYLQSSNNSSLQEESTQLNTLPQQRTSTSSTINSSHQNEQQQVIKCYCNIESVLREVKVNTINKGRFFWSCSKFGNLQDHDDRCNFFRWKSELIQNDEENSTVIESSSMAQNRINNPDVIESVNNNTGNNNNINGSEINLSPCPDQLSENEVVVPTRSRTMLITTPTTPHQRNRNRASSPQAPGSPPTRSQSPSPSNATSNTHTTHTTNNTRNSTGDVYTRSPGVFGNWNDVPKYSTPQLLDIVQNHLVQQDKNYRNWFTATQAAKKDLEEAMKEIEKLKFELEMSNRENKLNEREIAVLKAEKRVLENENNELKEENQELKRRRH